MQYVIDSHFQIGNSHSVCQDYATHWTDIIPGYGTVLCGVLCDGCSGSPSTDFGSRIIIQHIASSLGNFFRLLPKTTNPRGELELLSAHIKSGPFLSSINVTKLLRLPIECLDSTIWVLIRVQPDGQKRIEPYYLILGWGDGEVIIRKGDDFTIHKVSYPFSAPYYLNYYFDAKREKSHKKKWGGTGTLSDLRFVEGKPIEGWVSDDLTGQFNLSICSESDISSVTVCTDGLLTYNCERDEEHGSALWAAQRITEFKGLEGRFMMRRMRALQRKDVKQRIKHKDDIGAISIAKLKEEDDEQQC